MAAGRDLTNEQSVTGVIVAGGSTDIRGGSVGLLVAGGSVNLSEGSRVLMTTQQAIAFGAMFGALFGLVSVLLRKRR